MEYFDLTLTGDPARAKATVQTALEARKFTLGWSDHWTATAERGSKVANALAGAFAQFVGESGLAQTAGDERG